MSTVRYFRHDDAGAPTLSGTVGSLTALLRACLVGSGGVAYGAKASAGWTEMFIGAASNIAVFRNNSADGGSGCCALINDNAVGGSAMIAQSTVYATMSDISTGVNATSSAWVRKSASADGTARKWLVAADGLTAWVYVWENGLGGAGAFARSCALLGFGDYYPIAGGMHHFNAGCRTYAENNGDYIEAWIPGNTGSGFSVYSPDGVSGTVNPALCHLSPAGNSVGGGAYPAGADEVSGNKLFYKWPYIRTGGRMLGRLRGIIFPGHREYAGTIAGLSADVPGAVRIVHRGNQGGISNDVAGVLLDTVGPWP